MDKKNLEKDIIKIFRKWVKLPHYRIFFFGSRVNGDAQDRSDIDIGIEAPGQVPLHVLNEIKSELEELPVLQKFDVVDFNNTSEGFRKVALQKIEVIYEQ